MTAIEKVKLARDPKRPHLKDFIREICSDFEELHGDRLVNDDRGLVCGFGAIDDYKCLIMGHHKGATIEENMEANFGMANPDGYRKAMRLAKLAERFHMPIVSFVDTPGAYPGKEAEERGQAEAIAKSLEFFSRLKTPVVVVVTGEGGSGGAQKNHRLACANVKKAILKALKELKGLAPDALLDARYAKLRAYGNFF